MNLKEMHVWFRQFAQQMGMQNVRAILPEQIDLVINTSITDTVNQLIKENIGITNDRVITDNSKIGQINALRTLYKVEEIDMGILHHLHVDGNVPTESSNPDKSSIEGEKIPPSMTIELPLAATFKLENSRANIGKLSTNFNKDALDYTSKNLDTNSGTYPTIKGIKLSMPSYMFICDFSLSYMPATMGYKDGVSTVYDKDGQETNFFPVRLIDDAYLADTLNDFILKPRLRSPIIVTYNNGTFDIYIDKFTVDGANGYKLINNLLPYKLRFSYIAKPAKVKYNEDLGKPNDECDLPESMHIDILKHAVDLYRIAVSGSLQGQQQQETAQQRENMRNNYRNEGNSQQG